MLSFFRTAAHAERFTASVRPIATPIAETAWSARD
jgi:hypothetical protein